MIENQRGHIATIASLAGHVGITKLVDYCASKFAAVSSLQYLLFASFVYLRIFVCKFLVLFVVMQFMWFLLMFNFFFPFRWVSMKLYV